MTNELGSCRLTMLAETRPPNPMPRFTSMKLKPNARWRCSGATIRLSSVLLGPQPAPPKSASSRAAIAAWVSECACAHRMSDAASATTAIMMTRIGPNRSVSVPHIGLLAMPTNAAAAEQEGRKIGREAAHVVEVDDEQGQREALAHARDEGAGEIPSEWASDSAAKISRNECFDQLHEMFRLLAAVTSLSRHGLSAAGASRQADATGADSCEPTCAVNHK